MANTPRKIKITDDNDISDDLSFDAIRAQEPEDGDDEFDNGREPINLDAAVGLADAVAAASALPVAEVEDDAEESAPEAARQAAPVAAGADPAEVARLKEEVAASNNNY